MIINMTSYNRYEYLVPTVESLMRSDFPKGTVLYITDDASSDIKVHEVLHGIRPPRNLEVVYNFRERNVGVAVNETEGAKHCFTMTDEDHIILINNDCIFNPLWIHKLIEARESLGERYVGAITAFNYEYPNKPKYGHRVLGWANGKVRIKDSCGALGALIHRTPLYALTDLSNGWDCRYVDKCKEMKYGIYATDKSYVQHIGYKGLHSRENGQVDIASDFDPGEPSMTLLNGKIFVIGDSHTTIFKHIKTCEVKMQVDCATSLDLEEVRKILSGITKGSPIIVSLGEEMCRSQLSRIADGLPRTKAINEAVERIIQQAKTIQSLGYDVTMWGPVAQMDSPASTNIAFQRTRNKVTRQFTHRLCERAMHECMKSMSIFEDLVDSEDTTRKEFFRDGRHILYAKARALILRELKKHFKFIDERPAHEMVAIRRNAEIRKSQGTRYSIVMMAVNRSPKQNCVMDTVNSLIASGALDYPGTTMTISDSGSQDTSYLNFISSRGLPIKILYSDRRICLNENFSKAMAHGASETSDYVVFVEDDIIAAPGLMQKIDAFVRKYPDQIIWSFHAMYAEVKSRAIAGYDYWDMSREKFYGTLCIVIRKKHAKELSEFIYRTYKKDRCEIGADIRIHEWIKQSYPQYRYIRCSAPSLVQHTGSESSTWFTNGDKKRQNTSYELNFMSDYQKSKLRRR